MALVSSSVLSRSVLSLVAVSSSCVSSRSYELKVAQDFNLIFWLSSGRRTFKSLISSAMVLVVSFVSYGGL